MGDCGVSAKHKYSQSNDSNSKNNLMPDLRGSRLNPNSAMPEIFTHIKQSIDGRLFLFLSAINILAGILWTIFFPISMQMPLSFFLVPIASLVSLLWVQESFGEGNNSFGIICNCAVQLAIFVSPWFFIFNK
jgi:hypothetical protein